MKIAIMTGFSAKWNMNINACHGCLIAMGKNTVSDLCTRFNIFVANPFFEADVIDSSPGVGFS